MQEDLADVDYGAPSKPLHADEDSMLNSAISESLKIQDLLFEKAVRTHASHSCSSSLSSLTSLGSEDFDGFDPVAAVRLPAAPSNNTWPEPTLSKHDAHPPPASPPSPMLAIASLPPPNAPHQVLQDLSNTLLNNSEALAEPRPKKRRRTRKPDEQSHQAKWHKKNPEAFTQTKKARMANGRTRKAAENTVKTSVSLEGLRPSLKVKPERKAHTLDEVRKLGIRVVPWDGITPKPIITGSGKLIVLLAGRPLDLTFIDSMRTLDDAMVTVRESATFTKRMQKNRRGEYPSVSAGLSYGGGSRRPGTLKIQSRKTAELIGTLVEHRSMKRLAGYTNVTIQYAPMLSQFMKTGLDQLEEDSLAFRRLYSGSVYSCCTFNFGPNTVTLPHKDYKNLGWGWCSVTSFGSFDPCYGGHLILWEFGIAVEFPPYSTIMLPSAIVTHSNTSIQEGEHRSSVTQYNSSGLYRWLAYDGPKGSKKQSGKGWWDNPTHMFSTFI